jgi:hypothetical protein
MITVVENSGRGASAARNHASRLARGSYFQYLDADDLLEAHALETRVEALEETGAGIAISDWQRLVKANGEWTGGRVESGRPPDSGEPIDLIVFKGFWAPPAAILYRRRVWERVGAWNERLPVIQDARFLLDAVSVAGAPAHVSGVGARYRQHTGDSLSSRSTTQFWRDVFESTRELETEWKAHGRLDALRRRAVAEAYAGCVRMGLLHDQALFKASSAELERFPDFSVPKFIAAARLLDRLLGYAGARAVLQFAGRG